MCPLSDAMIHASRDIRTFHKRMSLDAYEPVSQDARVSALRRPEKVRAMLSACV